MREHESRFEPTHGPLRPEVEASLSRFLACGDPNHGVTLVRCDECRLTLAVPLSCKCRICPSCQARRAEDVTSRLLEVLPAVPYRHLTVTFPKLFGIRRRLEEDPKLLGAVTRLVVGAVTRWMRSRLGIHRRRRHELARALPGVMVVKQGFGTALRRHVHLHALLSDGVFLPDGELHPLYVWSGMELRHEVRRSVVASFVARGLMTRETAAQALSLPLERCGFSVHVGDPIDKEDREALGSVLRYILRPPLSPRQVGYDETTGRAWISSGGERTREFEHAVELLADWALQVPRARAPWITYSGHFANATGHLRPAEKEDPDTGPAPLDEVVRRARARWAALVLKVWRFDVLECPECGRRMRQTRAVLERHELVRLLRSLGRLGYPRRPAARPPPSLDPQPHEDRAGEADSQVPDGWDAEVESQVPPGW